jgi:hypothetical protein
LFAGRISFPPSIFQAGNKPLISRTTRSTSSWSASAIIKNL